jgi:hypothetical protein
MRMHALSLAALVGLLACSDTTSPDRVQSGFSQIQVPAFAAVSDTIRITFQVATSGCSTGLIVASERTGDAIHFSASVDGGPVIVCPLAGAASLSIPPTYIYLITPYHPTPFTVRFSQPGQPDQNFVVNAP